MAHEKWSSIGKATLALASDPRIKITGEYSLAGTVTYEQIPQPDGTSIRGEIRTARFSGTFRPAVDVPTQFLSASRKGRPSFTISLHNQFGSRRLFCEIDTGKVEDPIRVVKACNDPNDWPSSVTIRFQDR